MKTCNRMDGAAIKINKNIFILPGEKEVLSSVFVQRKRN